MELKRQNHEFPPVYDENSEILILGSFPSVKSREMQFFYGHPQNRFWKVMAQVLDEKVPQTIPEKKEMLLRHHIALWDVIASCDIAGSSDSSIRNVVPNDLAYIIGRSQITKIYANGAKSKQLYDKYLAKELGIEAVRAAMYQSGECGLQCGAVVGILAKYKKNLEDDVGCPLKYGLAIFGGKWKSRIIREWVSLAK